MPYPLTAILSDLHGNRPALEAALADARARGARRYVCLGDMVGYGAEPRFCLDEVMARCAATPRDPAAVDTELAPGICLKGNHEEALLFSADDFNPKARAAIEWTRDEVNRDPERSDAYWDFIGSLAASATDEVAMFAHGSPREPVREYVLPRDVRDTAKMRALFAHLERPVCFIGHSHVPAVYFEDGSYFLPKGTEGPFDLSDVEHNRAIVNVGSVGQPRDGDARLSYVLFDGSHLTFVRCAYDVEAAAAAIRAVPELPEYLAERLTTGR